MLNDVIKDISKGKDIESNLSAYASEASKVYAKSALVELAFEYFLAYDTSESGMNPFVAEPSPEKDFIWAALSDVAEGRTVRYSEEDIREVRAVLSEKMEVITTYVDRLIVYEYVLNRLEAGFTMSEEEMEEALLGYNKEEYSKELLNYIFSDNDQAALNDRLHDVLGQLPVRMSRMHYMELIKNSLGLYSESDTDSLDGYIYMLRTVAMLYEPEGIDKHFTDFAEMIEEFAKADYSHMDKDYYTILSDRLSGLANDVRCISDALMVYQKMINMIYMYVINPSDDYDKICETAVDIIKAVNDLYNTDADDADFYEVEGMLHGLEGVPERLYEQKLNMEAVYEDIVNTHGDIILSCGLKDSYDRLGLSSLLYSSSIFVSLEKKETKAVTEEYLTEVTDSLLNDIKTGFKKYDRYVIRAVMALTLSNLPIFFTDVEEVLVYIESSLEKCGDKSELIALREIMNDFIGYGDMA